MCVFLTTERLDAGGVEALDQRFEKDCFEVLVSDGLGKRGERVAFCRRRYSVRTARRLWRAWGTSVWTPEATPPSRESVTTEL